MSNFQEFVFASSETIAAEQVYQSERRKRVRTRLHWPVLIFRNETADGIESTTVNLSSTGFFCLSRLRIGVGESLFCTLRLPSHDPEGKARLWILECRASVRRVEVSAADGLYGVACEFEDYRLLASRQERFADTRV